eukprot:Clim_evm1s186 gene=Clim_evmTU1s186
MSNHLKGSRGSLRKAGKVAKDLTKQILSFGSPLPQWETEVEILAFRTQDDVKRWRLLSDRSFGGQSTCNLMQMDKGYARFYGHISQNRDKAVGAKRTGIVNMQSKNTKNVFTPDESWDLSDYDGIRITFRGDGRPYLLQLTSEGIQKQDLYQDILWSRGGGEWEVKTIPFDAFHLTNRGYAQMAKQIIDGHNITNFGITLADRRHGPFQFDLKAIEAVSFRTQALYANIPRADPGE